MVDRKKYKTNPNDFCYVCGKYTLPVRQQNIKHKMKTTYKYYCSSKVADQDKNARLIFAASLATLSSSSGRW